MSEYSNISWFCFPGSPSILIKTSSGDIKAKEGDLVNLLCSAQGEPPVSFSWEKDKKPLESFMEKDKPHRSSLLVLTVKDQTSFGKYTCHIRDRFESTTYTIWVLKDTCISNPTSGNDDLTFICFTSKQKEVAKFGNCFFFEFIVSSIIKLYARAQPRPQDPGKIR